METRKFEFNTESEADAFIQGVQWVNDSSIKFAGKHCVDGGVFWVVEFTDEDGHDEEEEEKETV